MQKDEAQKLLFVINPVSGGKEKTDWEVAIREYLKEQPHFAEFYILNGDSDPASVQHHINLAKPDKVVAVGGDGTVKMIAELVKDTPLALGILPAGSANGMAKELNIPINIKEALQIILNGECRAIDAIEINGEEVCIHLSDMGLNAMLVKYFEDSPTRGMITYAKGVFSMLWNKQKLYITIKTDKETVKRKAFMVGLANARKYGTGATINPEGSIDDGFFEVVVVRRLNFWGILNALITHKTFHEDKIEIFSTKEVELRSIRKAYFQVDGEYRGRIKELKARILPACINVMLPPSKRDEVKDEVKNNVA